MTRQLFFLVATAVLAHAQISGPDVRVYKTAGTTNLTAHIFRPSGSNPQSARPAIVLLHGGGWVAGSPEWVYDAAKRYAGYGAVAVAAEYRLSDQKTVTPLDAMADARDIIRWMRRNAADLGIQPDRIAVYGVSAGGQLAASLPTADAPDALVLISPAVSVAHDGWFQKILLGRASAVDLSPDEHVTKDLPPTAIFVGGADTLTPAKWTARFCDLMNERGGHCEIQIYPGVGHLFTRKLDNQEDDFDPDPKVVQDAQQKGDHFLAERGFLKIDH
jgi:acetyl esterase